jgi:tetratricopeptide (TPR) repeat protein
MARVYEQAESESDAATAWPAFSAERAEALVPAALLIVLTVVAYLPAMQGDFLWDDNAHVPRQDLQSFGGLVRIWTQPSATQQYYPVSMTLYWLQHKLWGDDTLGYHLVNVLLHSVNACLVLAVLRKLAVPGALFAAAMFAVHPVHVESVAWISEQKNTLSALFYLSAMWTYLQFDQSRQRSQYWWAFALFVLGLLSKSVIASLPAALLLVFWWQRGTLSWKRDWTPLLPFFAAGAMAGLFTAWLERTQVGAEGTHFDLSLLERFLLASRVPWFYAAKLVWPTNLMFVYPRWTIDAAAGWQWLFPLATFAVLAVLVFVAWQWKVRGPLAGVLYFLGTLFPVLGFLNVYPFLFSYVADHFQYLPSLGLIALAAAGATLAARRLGDGFQPFAKVVAAAVVGVLALLTWQQSRMYGDVITLYRTTIARNPAAWLAHSNLGVELADGGREAEAIEHYEEALRLKPDAPEVHYNYANSLAAEGRTADALAEYREALRLRPDYPLALNNLGGTLLESGDATAAIEPLEKAAQLVPYDPDAQDKLGAALMAAGRVADAAPHFAAALKLDPDHAKALNNMANALLTTGNPNAAIELGLRSVAIDPTYAPAHNNLGAALATNGRYPDAIVHFQEAVRLDPNFAQAYGNLMGAHAAFGQPEAAIVAGRMGLEVARATGKTALAEQIEAALKQLEGTAATPPSAAPENSEAAAPVEPAVP